MIIELIERLTQEAAKRDIDFLLIGGQAIGILGHLRQTMDIDLLVLASSRPVW